MATAKKPAAKKTAAKKPAKAKPTFTLVIHATNGEKRTYKSTDKAVLRKAAGQSKSLPYFKHAEILDHKGNLVEMIESNHKK